MMAVWSTYTEAGSFSGQQFAIGKCTFQCCHRCLLTWPMGSSHCSFGFEQSSWESLGIFLPTIYSTVWDFAISSSQKQPSARNLAHWLMINRTLHFLKGDRCSKPSFVVHSWNLMVRPWKITFPKGKYHLPINSGINYHLVSRILNFRGVSTLIFGGVFPAFFDHIIREHWSLEVSKRRVSRFFCERKHLHLFLDLQKRVLRGMLDIFIYVYIFLFIFKSCIYL